MAYCHAIELPAQWNLAIIICWRIWYAFRSFIRCKYERFGFWSMEHGPNGEDPPDHNSEPDVPNNGVIVESLPSRGRVQARGGGRNVSSSAKRLRQTFLQPFFAKASWNICLLATACHASASCPQLGIVCGSDTQFPQAYCAYTSDKNHSVCVLKWCF